MADGKVKIDVIVDDNDAEKKLNDIEDAAEDAGKNLEDLGDEAGKGGKGLGLLDIAAGNLVSGGIQSLISGIGNAIQSLVSLADETREFREDMAKLETAFKDTGHAPEDATKAYEDFYAILGESDRSVEAVNHLAELTKNTEELSQWSTICAGVTAKFGDRLPIEGLTEAANETAKVGQVTGPLADALNWAGISEEKFNEKLKKCNSEQERASLITKTLNTEYSAAAAEYNTLTASTQAARSATAKMEEAQATLGAKIEPLTTAMTTLKAQGFEAITPVIATVCEGLATMATNLMNSKSAVDLRVESARNAVEAVKSEAEAYRELKIAQFEQSAGDLAHIENARLLYNELNGIVDANGRVSEANKERAEFIVSTLNEALGLELSLVGNQIQQYGNLKAAVEAAIAAKQAEILLANDLEAYTTALENRTAKEEEQAAKAIEISEQKKNVKAAETEYMKAQEEYQAMIANAKTEADFRNLASFARTVESKKTEMLKEEGALKDLESAYDENEKLLQQYYEDINSYQEAQSLIMQGKTAEAVELLNKKNSAYVNSKDILNKTTEEQKAILEKQAIQTGVNAALMRDRYEKGVEGVTEAMVKTAEEAAATAQTEFEKIGGQIGDGIGKGAEGKKPGLLTKIRGIVSAMIGAAKDEADIHSPSKEFEYIGDMLVEGLEKGIDDNREKAINAIDKLATDTIDLMHKSAKTEVSEIEANLKERQKTYEKADKELQKKRDKNNTKAIDAQREALKEQYELDKEALQNQLDVAKERERNLSSYSNTLEKQLGDMAKIEEDYAKNVAKVHEDLENDIEAANKRYDDAFASRVASIKSGLSLFEEAEKGDSVKGVDLIKNLKSQNEILTDYNKALDELAGKGINQAFVDELMGMGVDALPQLEAINKMTDEQLTEYVALWEEKNRLATEAATDELATMRKETDAEIVQLRADAENELRELRGQYREDMVLLIKEIGVSMTEAGEAGLEALGAQIGEYTKNGEAIVNGIIEGIESQEDKYVSALVAMFLDGVHGLQKAADIHSPSRVMRDEIGKPLGLGVIEGWENTAADLKKTMVSDMSGLTANLRASVMAENSRFATNTGAPDTGFADLARAVGVQTAGINSLAGEYRRGSGTTRPIIIELNGRELGHAFVDTGGTETVRIGSKISLGGAK